MSSIPEIIFKIATSVRIWKGRALLVGGCARDLQLGLEPTDWDIEVYGLDASKVQKILEQFDVVDLVGESFSVWQMHNHLIDVSIPRLERKINVGHKGFEVEADSALSIEQASARRDFTINSLAFDPLTEETFDYYGGLSDLSKGILKHTSLAFSEDPLRVLRAAQFASRFRMELHPETVLLCKQLKSEYSSLPVERIWQEWMKLLLGNVPAMGLHVLEQTGWLEFYPELYALRKTDQSSKWHREGNVWLHACLVMNEAARCMTVLQQPHRLIGLLGALCHDLGKAVTTTHIEGEIHHYGHEHAGVPLAESFLKSIGCPLDYVKPIQTLVDNHAVYDACTVNPRFVRRLAHRLAEGGTNIGVLNLVVESDKYGRQGSMSEAMEILATANKVLSMAQELEISESAPKPILMGRELLKMGVPPGPIYSVILKKAYEQQLDGIIKSLQEAKIEAERLWMMGSC